jgi:hypothetical protein
MATDANRADTDRGRDALHPTSLKELKVDAESDAKNALYGVLAATATALPLASTATAATAPVAQS